MSVDRDELWVDITQFDTRVADGVWDGDAPDPDAPRWFADVRSLVHRARGPAEPDELVAEPVVVDRMRRATLGETLADLPHRAGVRAVGRLVAMKAAAATTASVMTVAAAAATTGIVATVAATVVVPAIHERIMPIIGDGSPPAAEAPAQTGSEPDGAPTDATMRSCDRDGHCDRGLDPAVDGTGDEPSATTPWTAAPEPGAATAPASDDPAAEQATAGALGPEGTTTTETQPATTTTEAQPTSTTTSASSAPDVGLPPTAPTDAPPVRGPTRPATPDLPPQASTGPPPAPTAATGP